MICHNGEINTLRGNVNWIRARQGAISSPDTGQGPRQGLAADLRRAIRLGVVRQRGRAPRDGRLLGRARDDDDDPGGVGKPHADGPGAPRVLRIPRRDDGAVGRPGLDRVHRRAPDRRDARPQRPAPLALHRHRRRSRDHGLGMRLPARSRGEDRQEVAPAARQDVPRRPREGPHRRRQGAEGHASRGAKPYAEWIERIRVKLDEVETGKDRAAQVAACRCSTGSRRSPTRRRTSSSSWSRWPWPAKSRSARWATTRRSRCSRTRTRRSITISSSSSRRSPTPRSTRSARSW